MKQERGLFISPLFYLRGENMSNIKKQLFAEVMGVALDAQEKAERAEEISKQDKQGARTAAQLEQKISFGKRFAEVMGVALDAQEKAEKAEKLDEKLTSEEIFNRLTNNGELQGLYRGDDGELYINAEYIRSIEKLFANDINMSGKFIHTVDTYLAPGEEEILAIQKHLVGIEPIPPDKIPLYDVSGDGELTGLDIVDLAKMRMLELGEFSMEDWEGAVKTPVTLTIDLNNPDKFLRVTGTNMWGREIDQYIGVLSTNIDNKKVQRYSDGYWTIEKWDDGTAKCWCQVSSNMSFTENWYNVAYYAQDAVDFPTNLFIEPPTFVDVKTYSSAGLFSNSICGITSASVTWFAVTHKTEPLDYTVSFMIQAIGRWK